MKKRSLYLLLVSIMLVVCSYAVAAQELQDCEGIGVDQDNDEYGIGCPEGEDCNDNDPFVNPGRSENCGNGVDDDCDGVTDEGDCCSDFDNDEYGTPGSKYCCEIHEDGCELSKTDCDNTDPDIHPGIEENTVGLCRDGLDNNCNGLIDQDDPGCAEYYPTPGGDELSGTGSLEEAPAGTGGGPSCPLESPIWANMDGDIITEASQGQDIALVVFVEGCDGEEVEFSIHKKGGTGAIEEATVIIEEFEEGEIALYQTQAPAEKGEYFFKAESTSEVVTSDTLTVKTAAEKECRIEWDCSALDYGTCTEGIKKRDICPGYEGAQCCSDEASCACTAIYPAEECETYTYAKPTAERTCQDIKEAKRVEALEFEEEEEEEPGEEFPWLLVIGIIIAALLLIGGIAYLILAKKPEAAVPASLLNYVKNARAKKVPDSAIQQALIKSGWKPEQISAALKKAK